MKLISMTEFVLEQVQNSKYEEFNKVNETFVNKVVNYANFLNQPLTLGMFVPCVDNESFNYSKHGNKKEFQQAKDKVLFEYREEFKEWNITDVENSKIEDLITDGFEYVLNNNAIKQLRLGL